MRIEREFLDVLNWELGVREHELLPHQHHLEHLASPTPTAKRLRAMATRKHTSKRSSYEADVPELSSPSSCSGSSTASSPRTPAHSQATLELPEPQRAPSSSPMEIDITETTLEPATGKSKSTRPSRPRRSNTLDLLLHFPLPKRAGHHKTSALKAAPAPPQPHLPPRSSNVWI
jgi:hypothetical protein